MTSTSQDPGMTGSAPADAGPSAELSPELSALELAYAHLKDRDIAAAELLLAPFEAVSTHPATLAMIARMRMVQGAFDKAHEVLARAEAMHPFDHAVWETMADLLAVQGRHVDELVYRRKLAYTEAVPPARAHLAVVRSFVSAAHQGAPLPLGELRLASRKISEAPGFTPEMELQFAEALYPVKKMAEEAKSHFAHASPCPAGMRDVTSRWIDLAGWCKESGLPLHRLGDSADPRESPQLAELSQVWLFPHFQWIPLLDDGQTALKGFAVSRMRTRREFAASPVLMHNSRTAELRLPLQVPVVDTPALLIGSVPQYYHHTVDFASRLAIAEALGAGTDLPLVVNDDLAPFQLEHLSLLGYPPERLIRVSADRPMRFSRLVVPSVLTTGGRWCSPMVPAWYRKRLTNTVAGRPVRLYLSRQHQPRRRVTNEVALVGMLVSQGFQVVYPEQLSVREQIDLFAGATHVVSPTGAALANMVYAPPGASIVCLQSRYIATASGDRYFDALSEACGHHYAVVLGNVDSAHEGGRVFDADIEVDLEAVRAAIG